MSVNSRGGQKLHVCYASARKCFSGERRGGVDKVCRFVGGWSKSEKNKITKRFMWAGHYCFKRLGILTGTVAGGSFSYLEWEWIMIARDRNERTKRYPLSYTFADNIDRVANIRKRKTKNT